VNSYELHSQIATDSAHVHDLDLCDLRLMDCRELPWLILVPRIPGIREISDLTETDQQQLMREITKVSHLLRSLFNPDKLNVAALGNVVPQLHVHVVARWKSDAAWPKPVWGNLEIHGYADAERSARIADLRADLVGN
jgi:diadenosine tetraphosphate (Ap4A) HIT family hydrolase